MAQATIVECARCSRIHNGAALPVGWGEETGHGLICDDCEEQIQLARITGRDVRHAA